MIQEEKSCPGCHFNHPDDSPNLKFHQNVGCSALARNFYIYRKDITASAKIVYGFNTKFPRMTYQSQSNKPVSKPISDDSSSDQVSSRRVHYPFISNSTIDSTVPPSPITNSFLLMPNRLAPTPTYKGYNNTYLLDSDNNQVFDEMVDSKTIKTIKTYIVVPTPLILASTPSKVLKKKRKIRGRTRPSTINQAQSDKAARIVFYRLPSTKCPRLSTVQTQKKAIYNNNDTACCADSG